MRVLYERCAGIDVGKDVIAVAVRKPGKGPTAGSLKNGCTRRSAAARRLGARHEVLLRGVGPTFDRSHPEA
jgi:hypothetical protein